MSKKILVAIHDHKAKRYGFPQTVDSLVDAERTLSSVVNSDKGDIALYPADFTLVKIGSYDSSTGVISVCDPHVNVCSALDLKAE
jgi:hypothetical protein